MNSPIAVVRPLIVGCVWTRPSNPNHERLSQASGPYKIFARGAQLLFCVLRAGLRTTTRDKVLGSAATRRSLARQIRISRVLRRKRMVDSSKLRAAGRHHPGGGRIAAIVNQSF